MAKRSSNGRQQPKQRTDGRWYVFLELGRLNGKRKRKALYGKTRAEVVAKLKAAEQQHASGADVANRQTVEAFLHYWLDTIAVTRVVPESLDSYRYQINEHMVPYIGHIQLRKLDVRPVEQMQAALLKDLAPATVALIRNILVAALNVALKRGEVTRNVAALVDAPHIPPTPVQVLSPEQAAQFFQALVGHRWEALFRAALTLGWRKSELLAVRWCDIDFDAQLIHLTGALKRRGGLIRDKAKTDATLRSVPLPENLAEAFSVRWSLQAREFAKRERAQHPTDYVFTTKNGTPISHAHIWKEFKAIIKKAGLPDMRMHDLRHSCAVLLVEQKAHAVVIRDILGHSNIQTTMNKYVKQSPTQVVRTALQGLDATLGGGKEHAK